MSSTTSPALPSGLRVREIQTTTVEIGGETRIVPVLVDGHEVELSSIEIPQDVESEGNEAIEMHVLEERARAAAQAAEPAPVPAPDPAEPVTEDLFTDGAADEARPSSDAPEGGV